MRSQWHIMANILRFDTVAACAPWQAIDDRVMGGMSSSRLRFDAAGWAVFDGVVSLQNQGGFASVRAPTRVLARAGVAGYQLNLLGDGRTYKFNLRTDDAGWLYNWASVGTVVNVHQ